MFLGGAGLADTMLYCRDKIYPLGLPNGLAPRADRVGAAVQDAPQDQGELPAARSAAAQRVGARRGQMISAAAFRCSRSQRSKSCCCRANFGGKAAGGCSSWSRSRSGRCRWFAPSRPAWAATSAGRACAESISSEADRDHHPRRQLGRHPRRRDLPRRDRKPDPPAARAPAVVRQAGGLSHSSCRSFARWSPRN